VEEATGITRFTTGQLQVRVVSSSSLTWCAQLENVEEATPV
jgi:hypothetical protein